MVTNQIYDGNTSASIVKVSHLLEGANILQEQLNYANISIDGNDNKLFIDPILIYGEQQRDDFASRCWIVLEDFFKTIFEEIEMGTFCEESLTLQHLGEKNSFRIGYSAYADEKQSQGKGCTSHMIYTIFNRIGFRELREMINLQMITKPMDVYLYVKGFGEDRMSDLITNIIFKELTEFTHSMSGASTLSDSLQTRTENGYSWNSDTHNWEEFTYEALLDFNGKPITLIPKRFLTNEYRYNPQRFFQGAILEHYQEQYRLENPEETPPTKKDLNESIRNNNDDFAQKDYIIEYTLNHPHLAGVFRQNNCNGALGSNYLGYLSDNQLTNIIELPYQEE